MKNRTVKLKTKRLIEFCGGGSDGRKIVATKLDVALSYIYRLEHGKVKPGKHLYQAILRLCEELKAENATKT